MNMKAETKKYCAYPVVFKVSE